MKKIKIAYWISTGLFAAFMLFSAVPDFLKTKDAVAFITQLGYPEYLVPFLGWAKALGVIAILIPRFPRLKEWAYAGLAIDIIGAIYSIGCMGYLKDAWLPMLIPVVLCVASYYFHVRMQKGVAAQNANAIA